jgi:hypothetical protein
MHSLKCNVNFIGKWHVSEGYREYWLTIEPNSHFFIEPMLMANHPNKKVSFKKQAYGVRSLKKLQFNFLMMNIFGQLTNIKLSG